MSTTAATTPQHYGLDPETGNLELHRGDIEDCSAPDCVDATMPPREVRSYGTD